MKNTILLFLLAGTLVFLGCAHTNNIGKYQFENQKILFETRVDADAAQVIVDIDARPQAGVVESIGTAVGSGIAGSAARGKLIDAVNTTEVCKQISKGYSKAIQLYLRPGKEVFSASDKPDFVVTTTLERYRIFSSDGGVFCQVSAEIQMTNTETGEEVWNDSECQTVALRGNGFGSVLGAISGTARTAGGVLSASQLLMMSKEEIEKTVMDSAEQIGEELGETLRKDIREARMK